MKKLPDSFKKSKVTIYETTDYTQFNIPYYQRIVTDTRKERLKKSYKAHKSFSIGIVNEDFDVINGQGRLKVCEDLGIAFEFVIIKGAGVKDFIRLNQAVIPLQLPQYLSIYSTAGVKDYQTFESMQQKYGFPITSLLKIAYQTDSGGSYSDYFRAGDLKFKDYKISCKIADHVSSFELTYGKRSKNGPFIAAVIELYLRDKYDPNRMEKKILKYGHLFPILAGGKGYVRGVLQEVYNFNAKPGYKI